MAPPGSVTFSPVRIGATSAPWGVKPGVGAALGVFPWGFSFAPAAPTVAGTRAVQIPWWTQEAGAFRQSATFVAGASGYAMLADEIAANVELDPAGRVMQAHIAGGADTATFSVGATSTNPIMLSGLRSDVLLILVWLPDPGSFTEGGTMEFPR